jgi:hypothetical protein
MTFKLPFATATLPGVVSTGAQSFAGAKTFMNAANTTQLGAFTDLGAFTLGPVSSTPTTVHTLYGGLSLRNANDALIGNNFFLSASNARDLVRYDTTKTGSAIVFGMNTGAAGIGLSFWSNKPGDSASTPAELIAFATNPGAWTFGPDTNYTGGDTARAVRFNQGRLEFRYPTSSITAHILGVASDNSFFFESSWTGTPATKIFKFNGSSNEIASANQGGAWTFGTSTQAAVHAFQGAIDVRSAAVREAALFYRLTAVTTDYLLTMYSDVGGVSTLKWRVEADGDTISSTGSYTSDERAKKLIRPIPYGLAEILALNPSGFRWNHEADEDTESFSAGTAQTIQEIMPELVRDDGLDDGNGGTYKAVYDRELVAVIVKAIQELKAENDALRVRVAALEA